MRAAATPTPKQIAGCAPCVSYAYGHMHSILCSEPAGSSQRTQRKRRAQEPRGPAPKPRASATSALVPVPTHKRGRVCSYRCCCLLEGSTGGSFSGRSTNGPNKPNGPNGPSGPSGSNVCVPLDPLGWYRLGIRLYLFEGNLVVGDRYRPSTSLCRDEVGYDEGTD